MNRIDDKLRKSIIDIAHFYGAKCCFRDCVVVPYVDVKKNAITLTNNNNKPLNEILSDFFHELGHIMDYRNGLYRKYYRDYPTKKDLRRFALRAELHTDQTGKKLMAVHFPDIAFSETYRYKKWQKFLKEYWGY